MTWRGKPTTMDIHGRDDYDENQQHESPMRSALKGPPAPVGEARTERKLFGGADNEEDADLALARVLQEQEKELYYIVQHGSSGGHRYPDPHAFGHERAVNLEAGPQSSGAGNDDDEQLAARMQAEELAYGGYFRGGSAVDPNAAAASEPGDEIHPRPPLGEAAGGSGDVHDDFTYEDLTALGDAVGSVAVGLSDAQLQGLRTNVFSASTSAAADGSEDGMCAVCRLDFEDGDEVLTLPCNHAYHKECIMAWLTDHKNCPICKRDLDP